MFRQSPHFGQTRRYRSEVTEKPWSSLSECLSLGGPTASLAIFRFAQKKTQEKEGGKFGEGEPRDGGHIEGPYTVTPEFLGERGPGRFLGIRGQS